MEQPAARELTDPDALRLFAHPMRHRIVRLLRKGPATSTTLAKALGENTGATSYHLRLMAEHGFIEEVPELAKGRERWWRSVPQDFRFPPPSRQTPEQRAVLEEVVRLDLDADQRDFRRAVLAIDDLGEWADALLFSTSTLTVTRDRLKAFFEDYIALLYKYRPEPGTEPEEARVIRARLLLFPEIDETDETGPPDEFGSAVARPENEAGSEES